MRVIICGGRNEPPFSLQQTEWLCLLRDHWNITEVITGGASGIDRWAEQWAKSVGIDTVIFPANWEKYGKQAGPIRNTRMLRYACPHRWEAEVDVRLVAFPGGPGTSNMIVQVRQYAVPVVLWSDYWEAYRSGATEALTGSPLYGNLE